jgi:hypothetical protein
MELKIDGDISIDGIKDACEQQQRKGFRLTGITGKTENALGQEVRENVAEFERALSSDILDELNFVAAQAGDKPDDIKPDGFEFICDAPNMFVNGQTERRVVFGKMSS